MQKPVRITAAEVKFVKRAAACVGSWTHTREDCRGMKGILDEPMFVCELTKIMDSS